MKGMKINFGKSAHFFEAGNTTTQEQGVDQAAKKAKRNKIIKWTAIGVGAVGVVTIGVKGIKKLVGKKSNQEVPAPEETATEVSAEETTETKKGKKADK